MVSGTYEEKHNSEPKRELSTQSCHDRQVLRPQASWDVGWRRGRGWGRALRTQRNLLRRLDCRNHGRGCHYSEHPALRCAAPC